MNLPIFTDEAIYVRWSQIARQDASWRFISLTDGKQPMFVWVTLSLMHIIKDPLFAGRLTSVLSGVVSMVGLFFLGRELFKNTWVGFLSSFLYLISPFALVYDRMALYDSMVGAFMVWSLYIEVLLVRKVRSDIAFILGLVAGGGLLTKSNAFFSLYLLPTTLLLFDFKKHKRVNRLIKWVLFALLSAVLAYLYYSILRLSPFYNIIGDKNQTFVYSFKEWLEHPLRFFIGNFHGLFHWFITYVGWPLFFLMIASFAIKKEFTKEKLLLVIWFIAPLLALAMFGKVLYPRFILFMVLYLFPLAALSILQIFHIFKNNALRVVLVLAFIAFSIRSDYYILNDFAHAPVADSDLSQYSNDWPAGGGIKEMVSFLAKESEKGKLYVATEGTFGSNPTIAVEIYLGSNKNIEKRGIWPLPKDIPPDLVKKAKTMPVYFVFAQTQVPSSSWPLKFINRYQKGIGNSYLHIYQVIGK